MKLMTQEIAKKLPKLYTNDGKAPGTVEVVCKYFNPTGAGTWYITEGEYSEDDGTYEMFGLCCIQEAELGYLILAELESYKGPLGIGIERDRSWDCAGKTLLDAYKDAGAPVPEWMMEREAQA